MIIKLHKDGSILESRIEDSIKATGIIWENYFKVNSENFMKYKIVFETVRLSGRIDA